MGNPVTLHVDRGIATITLADPANGNALGDALSRSLTDVVATVARRGDVRAVRLTGTGRNFCVGGDIRGMQAEADRLPEMIAEGLDALNATIRQFHELPVPVVTTVNGSLGGGGVGLALAADLVVATHSAKLRGGYTAIGLVPDVGTSLFLANRVGVARAKRILFLNEPLDSATCLDWGIFDAVYDDDVFERESRALVERLADAATGALGLTKQLLESTRHASLEEQLIDEREAMIAVAGGNEFREGFSAFLDKRAPNFRR